MNGIFLARRLARMAWARKAEDIVILDMRGMSDLTDFVVLCTGTVGMHVRAITDFVRDEARKIGQKPFVEEKESDAWMIADFVDVTFHCLQPEKRRQLDLEALWEEAVFMDVNPETGTAKSLKDARLETISRLEKKAKRGKR